MLCTIPVIVFNYQFTIISLINVPLINPVTPTDLYGMVQIKDRTIPLEIFRVERYWGISYSNKGQNVSIVCMVNR